MPIYKNIKVKNFRGFNQITLEGLSKINIFLGKNDIGKSSLLESVFLITGMSNPLLPNTINQLRTPGNIKINQLKYIFHNADYTKLPTFEAELDTENRKLVINPEFNITDPFNENTKNTQVFFSNVDNAQIQGLQFSFACKKKDTNTTVKYSNFFKVENGRINYKQDPRYKEEIIATYIPSGTNDGEALANFSDLVRMQKKDLFIDIFNKFDDRITNIEALPDNLYLSIKGCKEMLPISMAGDGIRRFINIIVTAANPKKGIVLIDEIENGLHHSAYELLWKNIIKLANINNIQFFITTHNEETLKSLCNVLEENKHIDSSFIKLYKIDQINSEGHETYVYNADGLLEAIKNGIELR